MGIKGIMSIKGIAQCSKRPNPLYSCIVGSAFWNTVIEGIKGIMGIKGIKGIKNMFYTAFAACFQCLTMSLIRRMLTTCLSTLMLPAQ